LVEQQKLLQAGDLDEAVAGIYTGRDGPGTDFADPRAHGSGFQRFRAFGDGYEGGP
jgi:predicted metalloprotease